MQRGKFYDTPEGDTVLYDEFEETGYRLYPNLHCEAGDRLEHFDRVQNLSIRDDDIMLASYPKTGANWLWEMMTMVLGRTSELTPGSKISGMLESTPVEAIDKLPSPRIIGAHLKINLLPKDAPRKHIKCVLLCRNPKDVAVSFYNHTTGMAPYQYSGKFHNYLQMFMRGDVDFGSYPEYLMEWQALMEENPDWKVHVIKYEDLKTNCFEEMRRLCRYLDQDVSDDLLENIVNKCCFKNMKQEKPAKFSPKMKSYVKMLSKNGYSLFRKGEIGDWKNWFTEEQAKRMDEWWKTQTAGLDIVQYTETSEI